MADRKPEVAEQTVPEVSQRVERSDISELADIEAQERAGSARKGVLDAVQDRREELTEGDDPNAPIYTLQELMDGAEAAFGVQPEVVAGAMRLAGSQAATKNAAQRFIDAFRNREV